VSARAPRRGPWRALVFGGAGLLMVGLALLVARPSVEPPAATPYAGARGASRAQSAGLEIFYRRGAEVQPVAPGTALRAGDVLRLVVRAERPRYLVVQLRDGAAPTTTVFPASGDAVRVQPGERLPVAPIVGGGGGKAVLSARFADHPFAADAPPDPDTEVVGLVMEKAP
jgi:hypothetical protein